MCRIQRNRTIKKTQDQGFKKIIFDFSNLRADNARLKGHKILQIVFKCRAFVSISKIEAVIITMTSQSRAIRFLIRKIVKYVKLAALIF